MHVVGQFMRKFQGIALGVTALPSAGIVPDQHRCSFDDKQLDGGCTLCDRRLDMRSYLAYSVCSTIFLVRT